LYSCQVPPKTSAERLTRTAVAERALRIGDDEGLEAITIRRLAQELGVTPMALYWHFKNKDELMLVMADVRADRHATDPWPDQLRAMVGALVRAMRVHPCLPDLLTAVDKKGVESFTRATDDALGLLERAGFGLEEGYWIASYLLHSAIGLVAAQPGCPANVPPDQVGEWLRQHRVQLQSLPAERYPQMVRLADTYLALPDMDRYFSFGIDLLIGAVEKMAAGRPVAS
jgi:TetR/AcrR family tetracycline transcriptional repressor